MQYNISYREKDSSWQYIISYKVNGKWKQKSKQGFPLNRKGKQQAKDAALKVLDKLKENADLKIDPDFEEITFEQFSKQYLEHTKIYNKTYKTIESIKIVLKRFEALNDIPLTKITILDVQKIIDGFVKDNLSPATIASYFKRLKIIFNAAKNQYSIITNINFKNIKLPKQKMQTKKALNDAEIKELLAFYKGKKEYLFIFLAVKTGMRRGEILGLTWGNIDFKNYIIHVCRQWKQDMNGDYGFGELKSKNSYRDIPISKKTANEISKYRKVINIDSRVAALTCKEYRSINSILNKKFGISIHELRHTYATKLIANGMDFKTAAQILGHDVKQTLETYSHVNDDMIKNAKNLIENLF